MDMIDFIRQTIGLGPLPPEKRVKLQPGEFYLEGELFRPYRGSSAQQHPSTPKPGTHPATIGARG